MPPIIEDPRPGLHTFVVQRVSYARNAHPMDGFPERFYSYFPTAHVPKPIIFKRKLNTALMTDTVTHFILAKIRWQVGHIGPSTDRIHCRIDVGIRTGGLVAAFGKIQHHGTQAE